MLYIRGRTIDRKPPSLVIWQIKHLIKEIILNLKSSFFCRSQSEDGRRKTDH